LIWSAIHSVEVSHCKPLYDIGLGDVLYKAANAGNRDFATVETSSGETLSSDLSPVLDSLEP
jgi:hypothetical protein